uniref:RenL n=1 Tax=Candidatus Endohaliclona renieramycinifaciens TaxID=2565582 RepID=A0A4D6G3C9_9GAMM|nr:RenL [Candidatus Endohaliclona renieramycinifaciens]
MLLASYQSINLIYSQVCGQGFYLFIFDYWIIVQVSGLLLKFIKSLSVEMRKRFSMKNYLNFIILLAVFSLIFMIWIVSNYNQKDKDILLNTPNGKAVIRFDSHGVPHVSSETSDLAVFFGLGYVHAKDRFWQMEFQRHVVKGTLSEIFGEATIPQDKFLRTWGFYRSASNDWNTLDEKTKAIINSYTAGINEFLKNDNLPIELILLRYKPQEWTNIDSIAWGKIVAWQLQNSWQDKIENYCLRETYGQSIASLIKPPYPQDAPTTLSTQNLISSGLLNKSFKQVGNTTTLVKTVIPNISNIHKQLSHTANIYNISGKGSNNWVISGKFTKSGRPILANDIHLELSAPTLWYLTELDGPKLHVRGASIPGLPSIITGRNAHIAWGITSTGVDTQDIYIVSNIEPIKSIKEAIYVKNSDMVQHEIKISPVGPIINDIIEESSSNLPDKIAVKWTALQPGDTTIQSFLEINYAKNWKEFKEALKSYIAPSLNFVYADNQNNIGYYLPGLIPIRNGWNGKFPIPLDKKHQWEGFIPFEDLPHVYNPQEGIIVSANNKCVPDSYPYELTYRWVESPYRILRLLDLLKNQNHDLVLESMIHIQTDTKNSLWKEMKPIMLQTLPLDSISQKALGILKNWDGDLAVNSIGATIFSFWFQEIKKMQPTPTIELLNLTSTLFIVNQLIHNGEFCKINNANNCKQYLSLTLQTAMQKLIERLGKNEKNWQWGKVHSSTFKALGIGEIKWLSWIWNRSISTPGDSYTVNVGTYNDHFDQIGGATYRQLIDLSDFENSYYIQALGQSGNPLSKHYDDLMNMWQKGQYIKMKNITNQ